MAADPILPPPPQPTDWCICGHVMHEGDCYAVIIQPHGIALCGCEQGMRLTPDIEALV